MRCDHRSPLHAHAKGQPLVSNLTQSSLHSSSCLSHPPLYRHYTAGPGPSRPFGSEAIPQPYPQSTSLLPMREQTPTPNLHLPALVGPELVHRPIPIPISIRPQAERIEPQAHPYAVRAIRKLTPGDAYATPHVCAPVTFSPRGSGRTHRRGRPRLTTTQRDARAQVGLSSSSHKAWGFAPDFFDVCTIGHVLSILNGQCADSAAKR
jgi:hypothetical protein